MKRYLSLVMVALVLVACASISPERIVPDTASGPERRIGLSVRLAAVTGARDTFLGGPPLPSDEQIAESILLTLRKRSIFSSISRTEGDLELVVTILSQEQTGVYPTTARMVANYKFIDRNHGIVWTETYDTSFSHGNVGGWERSVKANEGALRENLKALLDGINERWPTK